MLWRVQHAATKTGTLQVLLSKRLSKHLQRPFSLPNAFSTAILVLLKFLLNAA